MGLMPRHPCAAPLRAALPCKSAILPICHFAQPILHRLPLENRKAAQNRIPINCRNNICLPIIPWLPINWEITSDRGSIALSIFVKPIPGIAGLLSLPGVVLACYAFAFDQKISSSN